MNKSDTSTDLTPQQLKRFWEKVDNTPNPKNCWIWTACKSRNGYGNWGLNGKNFGTHRASWMIHNGEIPNGFYVLHKCDVPLCVNPSHLFLGTQRQNIADMKNKGRGNWASGKNQGLHKNPQLAARGSKSGRSVLVESQVIEIRNLHKAGNISQIELAKKFNCGKSTVGAIILRQTWAHI